jgi:hypothetical protein
MLYKKITKYLLDNNINIKNVNHAIRLTDLSDGNGPFIEKWDDEIVGLERPKKDDLDLIEIDAILLQEAKDSKKTEIKALRDAEFQKPLQIRSNPDIYLKPQPQTNIFLAAYSMADGAIKEWKPCDIDGVMQDGFIEVTKEELISASNHYEERKTLEYNQCHKRIDAIEALTTIEEVEAFDINQIIV